MRARGVVAPQHVEAGEVDAVVGVEVGQRDPVDARAGRCSCAGRRGRRCPCRGPAARCGPRRREPRPGSSWPASPGRGRNPQQPTTVSFMRPLPGSRRSVGRRASSGPRKRRPVASNSSGEPVVRNSYVGVAVRAHRAGASQQLVDVLGALLRAGHQGDAVPHHHRDHAGEQRVVGAPEDQRVDAGLDQRVEVGVRVLGQLRAPGDPRARRRSTNSGHAEVTSSTCGAAANASS